MAKPSISLEERLSSAQVAIDNAMSDEPIKVLLAEFGYDDARMQEGKALYDASLQLHQQQNKEYGEQYEASETLRKLWEEADEAYIDALKIARIALRDKVEPQQSLGLTGTRKKTISGWMEQAQRFFTNGLANPDIVTAMSLYGYNEAKLQEIQAKVQAVIQANAVQEKEKGEAQAATKERDAAFDKMDQWISDFKVVAMIALKDNSQWIEKLGLAVIE